MDVAYDWPWFRPRRKLGFRGVFKEVAEDEDDYWEEY